MAKKKGEESGSNKKNSQNDPNALVMQFQVAQQQLQNVLMQKETLNLNKMELERAIEELGKTKEKNAYKITGNIMINKPVEDLKKDLEETKEAVDIRLKSLVGPEKQLTDKLREIQIQLKEIIA